MPRQDPPLPEGLGKAFINSLMEEFAKERGMTLKDYLQDVDQKIAIEENFIDALPNKDGFTRLEGMSEEEFNDMVAEDYRDYRDSKRWLDED